MRRFLIASNLWVALAAGAFTLLSFNFMFAPMAVNYAALVGFATAAGYSYMRLVQWYQNGGRQQSSAHQWFQVDSATAVAFTVGYATLAAYFFFAAFPLRIIWWVAPAAVVALVYPIAFANPLHSFTSLRTVPGLKLFIISACWTYITYIIPLLLQHASFNVVQVTEAVFRLIFVAAITIPFDVRDVDTDSPQLKTLPQLMGSKQVIVWACFGLGLYQFWITARLLFFDMNVGLAIGWLLGLEAGYWLVKNSARENSDAYISFWVEGIPFFIMILAVLGQVAASTF